MNKPFELVPGIAEARADDPTGTYAMVRDILGSTDVASVRWQSGGLLRRISKGDGGL